MSQKLEEIYNFVEISDILATSGQPTPEEFSEIKNNGYEIIINLALANSSNALPNEREIIESCGMEYVHIPVVWENPTRENFSEFRNIMEVNADKKMFVHCAANKRVSAFVYLYRLCEGVREEIAKVDLDKVWTPNPIWQNFIDKVVNDYFND
ncbi:MAG: protein tyrosine phosphatase family protein [Cyanobacteria bacterium P01_A01_bin.45]